MTRYITGQFTNTSGSWQDRAPSVRRMADNVVNSDPQDRYASFHALREAVREKTQPRPPEERAILVTGRDTKDSIGNQTFQFRAYKINLGQSFDLREASDFKDALSKWSANKSYKEPTIITAISHPLIDNNGNTALFITLSSELDFDKAKALYRKICQGNDTKAEGAMYAEDGKQLLDWIISYQIAERIQKAFPRGLDDNTDIISVPYNQAHAIITQQTVEPLQGPGFRI